VLDALACGEIHAAHAAAIAEGYDVVLVADPTLDEQRRDAIVAELLDTAIRNTAGQVTSRAQALAHSAADDARARHEKDRREQQQREQEEREQEHQDQAGRSDHSATPSGRLPNPEPPAPEPVPPTPAPAPVSENPDLNRFDLHPLANGRYQFGGNADRLLAEKLLTALSQLTAPRPGPGGERDPRSPSKRRADALDQILDRHLHGSTRGTAGESRASVHLIVPVRDLLAHGGKEQPRSATTDSTGTSAVAESSSNGGAGRYGDGGDAVRHEDDDSTGPTGARSDGAARGDTDPRGGATAGGADARATGQKSVPEPGDADWPFHLDWTGPISRFLAELLTCDADLTPVIVDHHGVPLALGRTTRLASDDQRIALTIR
ncbi:DUF222 domain-containing protein, partial [Rhodococcoides fascians]|uniref:DUF222 domain-containing protein n=1 Tax=Rhodococcoides fascians TaxID=1828 RepID=UPI00056C5C6F